MEENKQQYRKVWISYLDDDGQKVEKFAFLISLSDTLVKFKLHKTLIVIPVSRLIKLKEVNN